MIIEIIRQTPIYAWILLALLIWKGLRATRLHRIAWKDFVIFPLIMIGWSFYMTYLRFDPEAYIFWIINFVIGILLAPLFIRSVKMRVDKVKKQVELSGSWIPLSLMVLIFSLRYFLGVMYGMHPDVKGSSSLLFVEGLAAVVSGILLGRVIFLYRRSKVLESVDLSRS